MASPLAAKNCVPCKGGVPPLAGVALDELHAQLDGPGEWRVVDGHHLEGLFKLKNFREALVLTNHIGELAEEQFHHPDLHLAWGKVRVEIWTHKINGLTESDFVFAAKCDALAASGGA
ncbi:MAG: 4a-hydroxytetrahydrobiopterin dehydratase [Myxococcales bacterium]|nr:4a-hydroxytetrahydrobiopterin dehydratase [Myxococcales bacterium]